MEIGKRSADFEKAKNDYYENKEILFQASKEFENILGISPDLKQFAKGFKIHTIEQIKVKHPEANALGLSNEKLLNLYSYDLSKIEALEGLYRPDLQKDPKESDYIIYAETPEEKQRFELAQQLCEIWTKLNQLEPQVLKPNIYVKYKDSQVFNSLEPNITFIKRL
jgi:hypothetical protein